MSLAEAEVERDLTSNVGGIGFERETEERIEAVGSTIARDGAARRDRVEGSCRFMERAAHIVDELVSDMRT